MPESAIKDHLDLSKSKTSSGTTSKPTYEESDGLIGEMHSFFLSLTMILFSEIGDKTFLIAALMAMEA